MTENSGLKINNKWLIFARKINRLTRYDVLISMLGLEPNWVCDADYCKAWCPLKEVK